MTEKRFKAHIFDDRVNERYHDGIIDNENDKNVIRNYQYINSLLNELNDENKELKVENEQLKHKVEQLINEINHYTDIILTEDRRHLDDDLGRF